MSTESRPLAPPVAHTVANAVPSPSPAGRRVRVAADDGAWLAAWVHEPTAPVRLAGADGRGRPDATGVLPTVVLAHGWTLSHESWECAVGLLQQRAPVRVVTYDQRGHGASQANGPGRRHPAPTVRALGDDLAAVVRATAPAGPLVLGGHSMGGMTVMAYAGTHAGELRERVRGVALVSTSAGGLAARVSRRELAVMRLISRFPRVRAGRVISTEGQRRLLFGDVATPEDVETTRRLAAATHLPTIGRYHAALGRHDESQALAALAGVPTRVVVGERDRMTPPSHARRLTELVPHARLDVLPGCGHMLPLEAADVVADHLAALVEGSR